MSSLRVLARTRSLYGGEDQLIFVPIPATLIFPAKKLPCLARLPTRPDGLLSGRRRSWPRPLLDRPSSHDALEILKRDPAAEFSGPNPNRRRPSQLDQLEVPVPAPDRHGGDAKLFLHLRIGDKRVVAGRVAGLDEGGVGGRGAAPFLERGTTPINRAQKIVGLARISHTIFA